jgi:tripartite-type tricarboxylate transporter receptor subunit TctC
MSIGRCRDVARLAITAVLAIITAGSVRAQDVVETFYKGRQINLIVGYGPGGGYDITARLLARHIGPADLPVVQPLRPPRHERGAGR